MRVSALLLLSSFLAVCLTACNEQPYDIIFEKRPTGISGRVLNDANGNPIEGATVLIKSSAGNGGSGAGGQVVARAVTDSVGSYSVEVMEDQYYLDFVHGWYSSLNDQAVKVLPGERVNKNALLNQLPCQIHGRITAAKDGAVLSGVSVQLTKGSGASVLSHIQSDSSGNYSFTGLVAQAMTLNFAKSGYLTQGHSIQIDPTQNLTLDIVMNEPGKISGTITAADDGAVLAGVTVQLRGSVGGAVQATVTTDAYGKYSLEGLLEQTYYVDFSLSGYHSLLNQMAAVINGNVTPLDRSLTDVVTQGRIYGRAFDAANGQPIPGVVVKGVSGLNGTTVFTVTTDSTGSYSVPNLAPGTYYLSFVQTGYVSLSSQAVVVSAGVDREFNVSMTKPVGNEVIRITLTWCSQKPNAVRDIDAYLGISGVAQPVFWDSMSHDGVLLDVDDTTWQGPETITINALDPNKVYTYYVSNYNWRSNNTVLGNSEVKVTVYKGSAVLKQYVVPQGTGLTYELFHIVNGNLLDYLRYNDSLPVSSGVSYLP